MNSVKNFRAIIFRTSVVPKKWPLDAFPNRQPPLSPIYHKDTIFNSPWRSI